MSPARARRGSSWTTGQNGFGVSAATGANGFPLASDTAAPTGGSPTSLRVASCTNAACSSPTLTTLVASNVSTTQRTSIAVGPDGLPVITYSDTTGHLHLAHCSNIQCTAAATTLVDSRATLVDASVTIGVDGLPVLASADTASPNTLDVTHCSNAFCIPNVRQR